MAFPAAAAADQEATMTPRPAQARILVVEDEGDIREMLEIVLTSRGYAVATAENGRTDHGAAGRHS